MDVRPKKTQPFGNEYHTIADGDNGVALIWQCKLREGKDRHQQLGRKKWDELGKTVGLMLCMTEPIHQTGKVVTMDSGFCVSKGIVEMHKKGVYGQALIKNMEKSVAKVSARR